MNILTPTGYKNIEDVNIGDTLVAFDVDTGAVINNVLLDKVPFTYEMLEPVDDIYMVDEDGNSVIESQGRTRKQVFINTYGAWEFYKINNAITLFKNQSIWANDRVLHAKEVKIGDTIYDDVNNPVTVTSIQKVTNETIWWKLTVSGDHSFISEGFSLHNASRYWSGNMTPTSFNWSYTTGGTNWGSATGVADNASVPTSTDDVVFDGAGVKGNSNSTIQSNMTVGSVTFNSGYTGTVTFANTTTLTIAGNFTDNTAHSWVVSNSACYITISATSTINSGGKLWPGNIGMSNTNTKTLTADWTASGILNLFTSSSTTTVNGAFTISVSGYTTQFNATYAGTSALKITGTTFTMGGGGNNFLTNATLQFAGNVTIPSIDFRGNLLQYLSGTVTTSGTLTIKNAMTIDTNPIVWTNVIFQTNVSATYTLNSLFRVSGTMQIAYNGATTFTGSAGFTVGTINYGVNQALALTNTFKFGNTYTITSSLNLISAISGANTIISSDATNRVAFILQQGATCNTNVSFTRVDNSLGRTINTWNGTVTNSLNVRSFTDLSTVAAAFST